MNRLGGGLEAAGHGEEPVAPEELLPAHGGVGRGKNPWRKKRPDKPGGFEIDRPPLLIEASAKASRFTDRKTA
jgi:hypothetical protein